MSLRNEIESVIRQVGRQYDKKLVDAFSDDTPLLESGLDSLDYAIVIARLTRTLGIDPISRITDPAAYPRTFGELIKVYSGASDSAQ